MAPTLFVYWSSRAKKNRLFMAASTSLYAVYVNTRGAQMP